MSTDNDRIDIGSWVVGFGERLVEERKRLGLSAEKMGELAGVKRQAQFMYEKGKRLPDAGYLRLLAAAGVDTSYLLVGVRFDLVARELAKIEALLAGGEFDRLLCIQQLGELKPKADKLQLARIDLLLSLLGESSSQKARDLSLSELARKSQLARERAAKLASGGLLLEVLATAYFHGINDEGAAQLAAMLAAPLAANS